MNIKNYTSSVPASSSINKIENALVEIGATNINKVYENKICTGITFLYFDVKMNQTFAFRFKAQVEECFNVFWKDVKRPRNDTKQKTLEQANRTAWKIVCDLVEIQCANVLLGQATPLQMFLSNTYDHKSNETLYEKVINGKANLLLDHKK